MPANMQVGIPVPAIGGYSYINLSASQQLKAEEGHLIGIFVASASSTPTIKLWDSLAASGDILVNTFIPTVGWWSIPLHFRTGLYITISGTVDCTVSFN